jgi:hypothetical protein
MDHHEKKKIREEGRVRATQIKALCVRVVALKVQMRL